MKDANTYDAAIIGGGHNGLICACYLAKAGLRVVVLERRHIVGGAVCTEDDLIPGYKIDVVSAEETDVFHNDAYFPMRSHLPTTTPILEELEPATTEAIQKARLNYRRRIQTFLQHPIQNQCIDRILRPLNESGQFHLQRCRAIVWRS